MFGFGPQSETLAWGGATGAAGALIGAGLGDSFDEKSVEAAVGVVASDASEPGVDDEADAIDRHAGFGDVGGDDNLGLRLGRHGGFLLFGREFTVQRENEVAAG